MSQQQNLPQDTGSEKIVRLIRPSVVVLCGPAACGKSTFAERHFRPTQIISSDWARARVCDDERDQRFQAQAFGLVHFLIGERLSLNRLCVVDSTALTLQARRDLLELAHKHQVLCVVFLFDVPLEKCLERDQSRQRTVGRAVIERQYAIFEQTKAGIRQEGFDQVIELRDQDLSQVKIEIIFRPTSRPAPAVVGPGPRPFRRDARPGPPTHGTPTIAHPARPVALAPVAPAPATPPPATTRPAGTSPAEAHAHATASKPGSPTPAAPPPSTTAAPSAVNQSPLGASAIPGATTGSQPAPSASRPSPEPAPAVSAEHDKT